MFKYNPILCVMSYMKFKMPYLKSKNAKSHLFRNSLHMHRLLLIYSRTRWIYFHLTDSTSIEERQGNNESSDPKKLAIFALLRRNNVNLEVNMVSSSVICFESNQCEYCVVYCDTCHVLRYAFLSLHQKNIYRS